MIVLRIILIGVRSILSTGVFSAEIALQLAWEDKIAIDPFMGPNATSAAYKAGVRQTDVAGKGK